MKVIKKTKQTVIKMQILEDIKKSHRCQSFFSVKYFRELVIMFHALQTHLLKYVVYWWCRKCQSCYHLLQKMVEQKTEFYLLLSLENQISSTDDKSPE